MITKEEARLKRLLGWNLRCNLCGCYGAKWVHGERPGWGALALCPKHAAELSAEHDRHEKEMRRFRCINYEQMGD